jgi:hypothetical protein
MLLAPYVVQQAGIEGGPYGKPDEQETERVMVGKPKVQAYGASDRCRDVHYADEYRCHM